MDEITFGYRLISLAFWTLVIILGIVIVVTLISRGEKKESGEVEDNEPMIEERLKELIEERKELERKVEEELKKWEKLAEQSGAKKNGLPPPYSLTKHDRKEEEE